jgi:hypothetical protein
MNTRVIRAGDVRPTGFFESGVAPSRPRTLFRDHTVEVDYAHGTELATLASFDAEHASIRLPYRTKFTSFAAQTTRVDHRIILRSTAAGVNGNYSIDTVERLPDESYLVTLSRSVGRAAVNVDLDVHCSFGDTILPCSFNSMSAVGGTINCAELSQFSGRTVISFSLQGNEFTFPSMIEDIRREQVSLSFQPMTSEPLERIARMLRVAPPPAGHLSLGYISQQVVRERSRVPIAAKKPAVETTRRPFAPDEPVWAQLPSHRVERV